MFSKQIPVRHVLAAVAIGLPGLLSLPAHAQDATASAEQVYKEIEQTMGGVPDFMKAFPRAGLAGAWAEVRDLEMSDKTALDGKTKALISLAVSAQIPCQYCIWADTKTAKGFGATDEEVAEAVGMAALTRHWSTIFNGLQVDFEQFKKDMGGQ